MLGKPRGDQPKVDKFLRDPELHGSHDEHNKTTKGLVRRANPGIRALNEKSVRDPCTQQHYNYVIQGKINPFVTDLQTK